MTVKIDVTTGLPKIPDDMVWNVVRVHNIDVGDFGMYVSLDGLYRMQLEKVYTKEKHYPAVTKTGFWGNTKILKDAYTETSSYNSVLGFENLYDVVQDSSAAAGTPSGYTRYVWGGILEVPLHAAFVKVEPLTQEIIYNSAIMVWDKYIEESHTDALSMDKVREDDKLLGFYPPKTLKGL